MAHEGDKESPVEIHGDVLEVILSHVPLIHLVPSCHVSKSWKRAVLSSLRHFNRPKPWLIVHKQSTRSPYTSTTHAYDPRSHVWIDVNQRPPVRHASVVRSSNSNLLYVLSVSKLSFSIDPLHLTWHTTCAPPLVWRTDPIVSLVGDRIVIAGGACDFDDDPLSVEIYDLTSRTWDTCDYMPSILKDSAASTCISHASNESKMFVTEKSSGITYSFDPKSKKWCGPYDLRFDPCQFSATVGFDPRSDRLIVVGLIGEASNVKSVKMWEVSGDMLETCRVIGEMPKVIMEELKGVSSSISLSMDGDLVYLVSDWSEVVVVCELDGGDVRRWESLRRSVVVGEKNGMERFVFTCASVGIEELDMALRSHNVTFEVKT